MTLLKSKSENPECMSQPSHMGVLESQTSQMTVPYLKNYPTGRLVIRFLQNKTAGATLTQILQHLRTHHHRDSRDLSSAVESILENGTAMGFLEKKGSYFVNWLAREQCCSRRRRRGCSRRRRRCGRRRRSQCSRRRRRCIRRRCRCRRRGRRPS